MKTQENYVEPMLDEVCADVKSIKHKYESMDVKELATEQKRLSQIMQSITDTRKVVQNCYDEIRNHRLPDKMEEEKIEKITLAGVGTVSLAKVVRTSIIAGNKEEFHDWLRANEFGELIKETVNSSTLSGFIKEQLNEGNEVPDKLLNILVSTQSRILKN